MTKRKYTALVCPFTHWDRAWYAPFETFRGRLVEHVDGLLDILKKDKSYTAFSYDGQTIPIEDYLQIRPEKRDEIARHVNGGRIALEPASAACVAQTRADW